MVEEKRHIMSVSEMLDASDIEYREIPTWMVKDKATGEMVQGYVRIRSLSAEEVVEWRETIDGPAKRTAAIRLLVDSLVDADGRSIGTAKDYEAFRKKSNAVIERILQEVVKLNGLTAKQEADTKKG